MRARLTLILAVACAALVPVALAPAAPSPSKPVIGIADQLPTVFSDPQFQELGLTHARIDLAWDVLRDAGQRAAADAYMQSARDHNIDVLITFDRSRRAGRASVNPTPAQFAAELKAMRKRWPWVHEFSTWNEVNIAKQPRHGRQVVAGADQGVPVVHDPRRRSARPFELERLTDRRRREPARLDVRLPEGDRRTPADRSGACTTTSTPTVAERP